MKKALMVMTVILVIAPIYILAQPQTLEIDETVLEAILAVLNSGLVIGIAQLIKQLLKKWGYDEWETYLRHLISYLVTLLLSAGSALFVLIKLDLWSPWDFILYVLFVWGISNGWWKGAKDLIKKHSG